MAELPSSVTDNQSATVVGDRLRSHPSLAGLRHDPRSQVYLVTQPMAAEVAQGYVALQRAYELTSIIGAEGHRAFGSWLDDYVSVWGYARVGALAARQTLRFTGTPATLIPAGTTVQTASGIVFVTEADATIPGGGEVDTTAVASVAGAGGNVADDSLTQVVPAVGGVATVTNLGSLQTGTDEESDAALIARFLEDQRDPPNTANPAQYRSWARQRPNVGGAVVLRPGETGGPDPGGVDIYLVDLDKLPAPTGVVLDVQNYIAPPRTATRQAEAWTVADAHGVTISDQPDDSGSSQRLAYDAAGQGQIRDTTLTAALVQPGPWEVDVYLKVNNASGATNLVEVFVWNATAGAYAQTRETGGVNSTITLQANDLPVSFGALLVALDYFWNGTDSLYLGVKRLNTDTTTVVYVDRAEHTSYFSSYDREGLAIATHRVQVLPAVAVPVDLVADVQVDPNYDSAAVLASVREAFRAYLRSIALRPDAQGGNDVIYGAVGAAIQDTPGVLFYDPSTLRVNAGVVNLAIAKREVATPDTLTVNALP